MGPGFSPTFILLHLMGQGDMETKTEKPNHELEKPSLCLASNSALLSYQQAAAKRFDHSNSFMSSSGSYSEEDSVKVVQIEGRGNALVSTKPLRGGQIILRDSPILLYSALPFFRSTNNNTDTICCCNCFKSLCPTDIPTLPSCPSCSRTLFCSHICQSLSQSSTHSPWVCQTLNHLQHSTSLPQHDTDLQVQAHFLVAAYNLAITSPSKFQTLLSLYGQPSGDDFASAQLIHSLIPVLLQPPHELSSFSIQVSASLLAKDRLNAFGLMEPRHLSSSAVRAYGIYPKASFFNHDCLPNTCRFDYLDNHPPFPLNINKNTNNTDIIFRLIHDIPQGRELCISYFPVNENYSFRQKRLYEDYGFTCVCDRCKVESNWDIEEDQEGEENESMDEDHDEHMSSEAENDNDIIDASAEAEEDDFPHSYFFLRYKCDRENCCGTLAPLPPSDSDSSPSHTLECNECYNLIKDEFADQ